MSIRSNLESIRSRIDQACAVCDRDPATVTLVAISKTQPIEAIREAYDTGQRHFGESRLQEALPKIEALPSDITWHFVGTLQSNKVKPIASKFQVIQTFCTDSQLLAIARAESTVEGFIEVNIAEEKQKSGISPKILDEFHTKVLHCRYVHFCGLMMIGPQSSDAEAMRPYFKELRRLAERVGAASISMGMSNDFEVAIQEGASHVRVGTAIFGSRV